jgi:hypothetical protein
MTQQPVTTDTDATQATTRYSLLRAFLNWYRHLDDTRPFDYTMDNPEPGTMRIDFHYGLTRFGRWIRIGRTKKNEPSRMTDLRLTPLRSAVWLLSFLAVGTLAHHAHLGQPNSIVSSTIAVSLTTGSYYFARNCICYKRPKSTYLNWRQVPLAMASTLVFGGLLTLLAWAF